MSFLAPLVLAAFLIGQGAAWAHETTFPTRVTARYRPEVFSGKVSSPRAACERRRFVQVVSPGGHVWAIDTTDRRGRWRAKSADDPPSAEYTVIVGERQLSSSQGHRHICSDASTSVQV